MQARVCLKVDIHEISEFHLVCEIHLPKYRNPLHVYDVNLRQQSGGRSQRGMTMM